VQFVAYYLAGWFQQKTTAFGAVVSFIINLLY